MSPNIAYRSRTSFLPEVREFIRDTKPGTNTTHEGGRINHNDLPNGYSFTGNFRFGSLAIYTGRRHWIVDQALGQV